MLFFVACIGVGVAAVVGVAGLSQVIEGDIREHSRELLGGDLAVESRRPLPDLRPHLPPALRARCRQVDLTTLPTMVRNVTGESLLAQVKAIDSHHGHYPLVGRLKLEPARPLLALLDERSVVVSPELAHDLDVAPGSQLEIGGQRFSVRGVVTEPPQRIQWSLAVGPELLMTRGGLERAGVLGLGDRVVYRNVLSFSAGIQPDDLAALRRQLLETLPGGGTFIRVQTHAQGLPVLRETLGRVQRFLGLVALLSLLLGAVGVSQIVSTWVAQAAPQTAVLRCLGFRPRDVMWLYLGQVLLMSLAGSLAGGLLGLSLPFAGARLYPAWIPSVALVRAPLAALLQGVLLGTFVALLFSVPPLLGLWRISPARVLRSEAEPLPVPSRVGLSTLALCVLGVVVAAYLQARDLSYALAFSAGLLAVGAALWLVALGLQRLVSRLPRDQLPPLLWQGLSTLVRPGAGTIGGIVALGLGTMIVLSISLVERTVVDELDQALSTDAPSMFLIDVQPDQWAGMYALTRAHGAHHVQSAPVVMARLSAVNGRSVDALVKERERVGEDAYRQSWLLTREQRLTFKAHLSRGTKLVAGALWDRPGQAEVSVERDYARDLDVGVGGTLSLDVQGVLMTFVVSSIRDVEWRSFEPNFFLVAEPGYLEDAPQFRLVALRAAPAQEQALQDAVSANYPNVTVIRVRAMLTRARDLLSQVALGLRLLGGFAVITGLVILVGAVAAAQLRRAREVALLKTLGITRLRVVTMLALEYALRGLLAGVLGAVGAYALSYTFTHHVLQLSRLPSALSCGLAVVAVVLLSMIGGLLASARALRVSPLQVLREER